MTNIFQKIGNSIEREKKEDQKKEKRYWKLSSLERIDYNQELEKIRKRSEVMVIPLTKIVIGTFLILSFMFLLGSFGGLYSMSVLVYSLKTLSLNFSRLIGFAFIIDILYMIFNLIFNKQDKKIKELDKRFKLC